MRLKDINRKAKVRAAVEQRLPNLEYDVLEELIEITFEQSRTFDDSVINFIGYIIFGVVLTAPFVWLSTLVIDTQHLQILCAIIICSSIIIGLVILAGYNIYSRVARSELYLNTLHQEIRKSNST